MPCRDRGSLRALSRLVASLLLAYLVLVFLVVLN